MGKCRNCEVCTRSFIGTLLGLPFTLIYWVPFSWNIGLFKRSCPDCGHWMSQHQRLGERRDD